MKKKEYNHSSVMILFLHAMNPQIISMTCPNLSSIWEGQMIWRAGTFENFGIVCQSVTYRRAPFLYFLFTILVELLDQSIYSPPCLSSDFYFYNTTCISIYIGTFSMGGALRVVKLAFS